MSIAMNTLYYPYKKRFRGHLFYWLMVILMSNSIALQAQQQAPCGGDSNAGSFCVPAYQPNQPIPHLVLCVPNCEGEAVFMSGHLSLFGCGITELNDTCFRYTPLPGQLGNDEVTITMCYTDAPENCSEIVFNITIDVANCQPNPDACNADAGTLSLASNEVIVGNPSPAATVSGQATATDYTYLYLLTQDSNPEDAIQYNVVATSASGTFNSLAIGSYRIHGVSFKGTIPQFLDLDVNTVEGLLQLIDEESICAEVQAAGAAFSVIEEPIVVDECLANGGLLTLAADSVTTGNTSPQAVVTGALSSEGYSYIYVLAADAAAQGQPANIVFLEENLNGSFDMSSYAAGNYFVLGVSYKGTPAQFQQLPLNNLDDYSALVGDSTICANSTGDVFWWYGGDEEPTCAASGGNIFLPDASVAIGEISIAPTVVGAATTGGLNYYFLLTTTAANNHEILALSSNGSFNFSGFNTGQYMIFGISLQGTLALLENYTTIESIQQDIEEALLCADFSFNEATVTVTPVVENNDCEQTVYTCSVPITPLDLCIEFCNLEGNIVIDTLITTYSCSVHYDEEDGTCIRYTALPGYTGLDSLIVIGHDETGAIDTVVTYIKIECMTPNAVDDFYTVVTTNPASTLLTILNNDEDLCPNISSMNIIDQAEHGDVVNNGNGTFSYYPDSGFSGTDSFVYQICNNCSNTSLCDTAVVTIAVNEVQNAIDAVDDQIIGVMNEVSNIQVLQNDEADGAAIVSYTQPANGSVSLNGSILIYTPDEDFEGTDTFSYTICNVVGECDEATVTIIVDNAEINSAPIAVDDSYTLQTNEPVVLEVLQNDMDDNPPLVLTGIFNVPENVSVTIQNNAISVGFQTGAADSVAFNYVVCDTAEPPLCDTALVTIVLENITPPDTIIAINDTLATNPADTLQHINVLENDLGENIVLISFSQPQHGVVLLNTDGTLTYIPDGDFEGTDSFTYTMCNNNGDCDEATVYINVDSDDNDAPIAQDDMATTDMFVTIAIDVAANDSDPNGDELSDPEIVSPPQHGTATVQLGQIVYEPADGFYGTDTFTYSICDTVAAPSTLCDTATVTIVVLSPLDAEPDVVFTQVNTPVDITVLPNDIGTDLEITSFVQPLHGAVIIQQDNETFTYTPEEDFTGTDYFIYTVCNADVLCDSAVVSIVVSPLQPNLPPHAVNDALVGIVGDTLVATVMDNDSDPNGDDIFITIVENPAQGTVEIINDGQAIQYVPPTPAFDETVTFDYVICDTSTACDTATVVISYNGMPSNHPPLGTDDAISMEQGDTVEYCALLLGFDTDGDELSYEILTPPINGAYEINENNCIVYTPNTDFLGDDHLTYLLCDDGSPVLCDTVSLTIHVTSKSDETLQAIDDETSTSVNTAVDIDVLENDKGGNISITSFDAQSPHGTITEHPDSAGVLVYEPDAGFFGTDTFTYIICLEPDLTLCDTASVFVQVVPPDVSCQASELFIPEGITPNGDNINDEFIIEHLNECFGDKEPELLIFNRWGNEVYRKTGYTGLAGESWNGTWQQNDEPVPDGTYFYILHLNTDTATDDRSGTIEVYR